MDFFHAVRNWLQRFGYAVAGAAFLAAIPVWLLFFLNESFEIHENFSLVTHVNSFDNFYDVEKGVFTGERPSATVFSYRVVGGDSRQVSVENTFDVRTLSGDSIFKVSRIYGIDAHTGKHVAGLGDRDRAGYLFAPRMKGLAAQVPDKAAFEYWHVNYNTPARMEYQAEEMLYSLRVYRYEADLTADQTKELAGILSGVGKDKGITLNAHLTLWFEPYTGRIVQYADQTEAFYYDLSDGRRLYPWNSFHNNTAIVSAAQQAKLIEVLRVRAIFLEFFIPGFFLLASLLCFLYPRLRRSLFGEGGRVPGSNAPFLLPLLAASALMIPTIILSFALAALVRQQADADFNAESALVHAAIERRLETNADVLRGAQGLFSASDLVKREAWRSYSESLGLEANYPAILGLGFGKAVRDADKSAVENETRKEGFVDFGVRPSGTREWYVLVYYIEPFVGVNRNAIGFDMASEAVRRAAIDHASSTGSISMTGKIFLVQDSGTKPQPAFIVYAPVYEKTNTSLEPRKPRVVQGYVYAALRLSNLMAAILSKQPSNVGIEIFDGGQTDGLDEERLMYKNDLVTPSPAFTKVSIINLYNHQWVVRYSAPASFHSDVIRSRAPWAVLVFGLIFSLLVALILYVVNTQRARAEQIAMSMTSDLRRKNEENERIKSELKKTNLVIEEKAKILSDKVAEVESINKHMVDRELRMIELKKQLSRMRGEDDFSGAP